MKRPAKTPRAKKTSKKSKKLQDEALARRGLRWLTIIWIEFFVFFVPIFAISGLTLAMLLLITGWALLLIFYLIPFAYVAWIAAIINFVAVLRIKRCDDALQTKIMQPLLSLSVALLSFMPLIWIRDFPYLLCVPVVYIIAGIIWFVFRRIVKQLSNERAALKQSTLKHLRLITLFLSAACVILSIGGELYHQLYAIPRAREATARYDEERREKELNKMNETIQPLIEAGMDETLAQISYVKCYGESSIIANVGDNILLSCDDGDIFELKIIDDNAAIITEFDDDLYFRRARSSRPKYLELYILNRKTHRECITILINAQSEDELLAAYADKIAELSSHHVSYQIKVFYVSQNALQEVDLITLAMIGQEVTPRIRDPYEKSVGGKTFHFTPMEKSLVLEEIVIFPSVTVKEAFSNRHLEIDLKNNPEITPEDLDNYWVGP